MLALSHFIQDKFKIPIASLNKVNAILFFIVTTKRILIIWLLKKPADPDLHCFQWSLYLISSKSKYVMGPKSVFHSGEGLRGLEFLPF